MPHPLKADLMGAPQRTCTVRRRVTLGINYPQYENWLGLYFGPNHRINPTQVPPNVNDAANNQWRLDFEDLLQHYKRLGVSIVRVFLLGNAWNYGHGHDATFESPDPAKDPKFWSDSTAAYEQHMRWMLEAAVNAKVKLIPSLISFVAFFRGGSGNGGRGAIITRPRDRSLFFELFRVLLAASTSYREAIFAWEMVNEPVWVTQTFLSQTASSLPWPFPSLWNGTPTIPHQDMVKFLQDGVSEIASYGFDYTNGHNFERTYSILGIDYSDDTTFPVPASTSTSSGTRYYLPQYHYYPDGVTRQSLRSYADTLAFIGELSSRPPVAGSVDPERWPWGELAGADGPSGREAVFRRLCWAEHSGYPLAFLWPDDEHHAGTSTILSAHAEAGVTDYLSLPNPYP